MAVAPIEADILVTILISGSLFNLLFYTNTDPYQALLGLPLDTAQMRSHFRWQDMLFYFPRALVIRSQCKAAELVIIPEYSGVTTNKDARPVLKDEHAASPSTNPGELINQLLQLCPIKAVLDQPYPSWLPRTVPAGRVQ